MALFTIQERDRFKAEPNNLSQRITTVDHSFIYLRYVYSHHQRWLHWHRNATCLCCLNWWIMRQIHQTMWPTKLHLLLQLLRFHPETAAMSNHLWRFKWEKRGSQMVVLFVFCWFFCRRRLHTYIRRVTSLSRCMLILWSPTLSDPAMDSRHQSVSRRTGIELQWLQRRRRRGGRGGGGANSTMMHNPKYLKTLACTWPISKHRERDNDSINKTSS